MYTYNHARARARPHPYTTLYFSARSISKRQPLDRDQHRKSEKRDRRFGKHVRKEEGKVLGGWKQGRGL